jgi:hypothetical protein
MRETAVWSYKTPGHIRFTSFTPDGSSVAVVLSTGGVLQYDTATGKETARWDLPTRTTTITRTTGEVERYELLAANFVLPSPEGAKFVTSAAGEVVVWDRVTGKRLREFSRPGRTFPLGRFFPDGQSIVLSDGPPEEEFPVRIDLATGTESRLRPADKGWADAVAVAPSGRIAAYAMSRQFSIREIATGKERWSGAADGGPARGMAGVFSPDGRFLATSETLSVIRLWDAIAGRELARLDGGNGDSGALAFSPDGKRLVTAGGNAAVVWDIALLAPVREAVPPPATEKDLAAWWDQLGDADPRRAVGPLAGLTRGGEEAAAFLRQKLAEPPPVPADRIQKWVGDLGSDKADVREAAARELEMAGASAEPALRAVMAAGPDATVAERIRKLLAPRLIPAADMPVRVLRADRGLEVLELAGDVPAREALRALAAGAPDPRVRSAAAAAVRRLERRP